MPPRKSASNGHTQDRRGSKPAASSAGGSGPRSSNTQAANNRSGNSQSTRSASVKPTTTGQPVNTKQSKPVQAPVQRAPQPQASVNRPQNSSKCAGHGNSKPQPANSQSNSNRAQGFAGGQKVLQAHSPSQVAAKPAAPPNHQKAHGHAPTAQSPQGHQAKLQKPTNPGGSPSHQHTHDSSRKENKSNPPKPRAEDRPLGSNHASSSAPKHTRETSSKSNKGNETISSKPWADDRYLGLRHPSTPATGTKNVPRAVTNPPSILTRSHHNGSQSPHSPVAIHHSPNFSGAKHSADNSSRRHAVRDQVATPVSGMKSALPAVTHSRTHSKVAGSESSYTHAGHSNVSSRPPAIKGQAPNYNKNITSVSLGSQAAVNQSGSSGLWGAVANGLSSFFGWAGPTPSKAVVDKSPTSHGSKGQGSRSSREPPAPTYQTPKSSQGSMAGSSKSHATKARASNTESVKNGSHVAGNGSLRSITSNDAAGRHPISSTSKTIEPRQKQVPSSSGKESSGPQTALVPHHGGLLRPSPCRDLVLGDSDHHRVTSAFSTVTAAPLPTPPKNELRNKAARQTIAKNPELFKVVTPIKVDRFEELLKEHPNQAYVKSVCRSLRTGFWPWADTSKPNIPRTPEISRQPRHSQDKAEFIRQQRDEEVELGRWSKPFKKLLPGMLSSPIGAIPKKTPGEFRLVVDHSRGAPPLNSFIPKSQHKVNLDNLHDLGTSLVAVRKKHGAKRKLVVFKSDVKSAYRQMPLHPLWQIKQGVTVDGKHHIDRCNSFGSRAGGWIWDSFMPLVNWIGTEVKGIRDLHGYVDDDFSWEFANKKRFYKPYKKHLPAKQARLLELWDELGIPHDESKQLHGPSLPIIGYDVDANKMTIGLPAEKKAAVVGLIRDVAHEGKSFTLEQLQSASGSIRAVLDLYPDSRPRLRSLFDEMAGKQGARTRLEVTKPISRELRHLANSLDRAGPVPIQEIVGG